MASSTSSTSSATQDAVKEICGFLRDRGIAEDVIMNFDVERMDFGAINQASDDILQCLGLTRKGDILSLRGYCEQKLKQASDVARKGAQEETKRKLLASLLNQKKNKTKKSGDIDAELEPESKAEKRKKVKTRRIQMGWLHFDQQQGRYVSMRPNKGGGTREIDIPLDADVQQMIDIAKDLFFPKGETTVGHLSDFVVSLANFQCQRIPEFDADGERVTLKQYIDTHKITRIRVYLQTKHASHQPTESGDDTAAEDDIFLLQPTFSVQQSGETSVSLIGSSDHTANLRKEQEEEYLQSLTADAAKEEKRRREMCDERERTERQLRLHRMRSARVESEPLKTEPKIEVSVRHIHLGVVSRSFYLHNMMSHVYDWVGSLDITPEYFQLCAFDGKCLLPSESVAVADRQMLYMAESENMPNLLEGDPEINFTGFGSTEDSFNDTIPLDSTTWQPSSFLAVPPVPDHPPEQLMESDDLTAIHGANPCSYSKRKIKNTKDPGRQFRMMVNSGTFSADSDGSEEIQEDDFGSHSEENPTAVPSEMARHESSNVPLSESVANETTSKEILILRIRRARVYRDMIEAFQAENIMTSELKIVMVDLRGQDERGVDVGGVYRDAIACFWQEFNDSSTLGERERVPALRHDFQSNEWSAIARIITKGYFDLGYFPCALSQAFIVSVIFGENTVPEEILLKSFQNYIAKDEEHVVAEALTGNFDADELTDVLDRFGCRKVPTKENARYLILEVAHKEILQKPQYVADAWREALTMLKSKEELATIKGLRHLYQTLEPTNRKVLSLVRADPQNNSERAAIEFLKRLVRGMDKAQLKSFLRFVTGADVICVPCISVQFSILDGLARRPIAHTCGSVLELPSTYDTFPELREEFNNILAKTKWQNDIM